MKSHELLLLLYSQSLLCAGVSTSSCDPKGSGSPYAITYNCVACADNAITFNDGYHIQHHLNSKTHWSDLPKCFLESLEEHAAQGGEQQPPHWDDGPCLCLQQVPRGACLPDASAQGIDFLPCP